MTIERLARIEHIDPILEAWVLYQASTHLTTIYMVYLNQCHATSVGMKKARTHAKQHGISIVDIVDRVYPNFAIVPKRLVDGLPQIHHLHSYRVR